MSDTVVYYENNQYLQQTGLSFHWWKASATSFHTHNFYEIFIVTSGEAEHTINGVTEHIHRGKMRFILPADRHMIVASKENGCVHLNLCMREEKLNETLRLLAIERDDFFKTTAFSTSLSSAMLDEFIEIAEKINLREFHGETDNTFLIAELIVRAIIHFFESGHKQATDEPQWFSSLLAKIHTPDNIDISVHDVYALSPFSPPVTIDAFKTYTGKNINTYLRDMKCNHACFLLETTQDSILNIATTLGYFSLSHFIRIFKSYTGTPPGDYRKNFQKK